MRKRKRLSKLKMLKVFGAVLALFSFLTIIWPIAFYIATS
ncbi:two-component sensor histidine kinase, partial [Bacillus thuringiensis]|nr:two-component sensor histidine kinase [Bacillus thuringiensis]